MSWAVNEGGSVDDGTDGIAGGKAGGASAGDGGVDGVDGGIDGGGDTGGNAGASTGSDLGVSVVSGLGIGVIAAGAVEGNGLTGADRVGGRVGGRLGGPAKGATSGSDGRETAGGAPTAVPPGGNRLGAASTFGRGETIRDASNFGGSPTGLTGTCPEANAISERSCGAGSVPHWSIRAGSATVGKPNGGRLGITPPSEAIASESTTIGFAKTAE